jgi:hypothetical protein
MQFFPAAMNYPAAMDECRQNVRIPDASGAGEPTSGFSSVLSSQLGKPVRSESALEGGAADSEQMNGNASSDQESKLASGSSHGVVSLSNGSAPGSVPSGTDAATKVADKGKDKKSGSPNPDPSDGHICARFVPPAEKSADACIGFALSRAVEDDSRSFVAGHADEPSLADRVSEGRAKKSESSGFFYFNPISLAGKSWMHGCWAGESSLASGFVSSTFVGGEAVAALLTVGAHGRGSTSEITTQSLSERTDAFSMNDAVMASVLRIQRQTKDRSGGCRQSSLAIGPEKQAAVNNSEPALRSGSGSQTVFAGQRKSSSLGSNEEPGVRPDARPQPVSAMTSDSEGRSSAGQSASSTGQEKTSASVPNAGSGVRPAARPQAVATEPGVRSSAGQERASASMSNGASGILPDARQKFASAMTPDAGGRSSSGQSASSADQEKTSASEILPDPDVRTIAHPDSVSHGQGNASFSKSQMGEIGRVRNEIRVSAGNSDSMEASSITNDSPRVSEDAREAGHIRGGGRPEKIISTLSDSTVRPRDIPKDGTLTRSQTMEAQDSAVKHVDQDAVAPVVRNSSGSAGGMTPDGFSEQRRQGQEMKRGAHFAFGHEKNGGDTRVSSVADAQAFFVDPDLMPQAGQAKPEFSTAKGSDASFSRHAEVYKQVENGAFSNLSQGGKQLVIRLDPPELGHVSVVLQVRGKDVQAVLRATSPEATQALNEQLGQLRSHLEAQGLRVGKLEVQTQLPDAQTDTQWQGAEQHNEHQKNRETTMSSQRFRFSGSLDEGLVQDVQDLSYSEKDTSDGLDIFA